jgi:hypothetical protein
MYIKVILLLSIVFCLIIGDIYREKLENNDEFIISGKGFSLMCKYIFCERYNNDFNNKNIVINENDKIFVGLKNINEFCNVLKRINPINKFILIIHNNDEPFTENYYNLIKKYVNRVYACNNVYNHPNIYTIPEGFRDWPSKTYPILKKTIKINYKSILIYMNFTIATNTIKRKNCFEIFENKQWVTKNKNLSIEKFYNQLSKSKYILSPEGAGVDCHRIYESIYFDAIPIIETSKMDNFFKKLPLIIINDYKSITKQLLEKEYNNKFKILKKWKEDNPRWIYPNFWINI